MHVCVCNNQIHIVINIPITNNNDNVHMYIYFLKVSWSGSCSQMDSVERERNLEFNGYIDRPHRQCDTFRGRTRASRRP
jgi:hypothetical protein